jgi:hypothetical protein
MLTTLLRKESKLAAGIADLGLSNFAGRCILFREIKTL